MNRPQNPNAPKSPLTFGAAILAAAFALGLIAMASPAEAAIITQDQLTTPGSIFVGGMVYGSYTDGEWAFLGEVYQNHPVFTHTTSGWSMYRRSAGYWVVDFNDISEDWNGTVAYGGSDASSPLDTVWNSSDVVMTRQRAVVANWRFNDGILLTFNGETQNGQPIYESDDGSYFVYYSNYGLWKFGPSVTSSGYSQIDCDVPWGCGEWSHYEVHVIATTELTRDWRFDSMATFGFEGDTQNGEAIFQNTDADELFYMSAYGNWKFGPSVTSTGYSQISCTTPFDCGLWSTYEVYAMPGAVTSSTTVALRSTAFGTYVTAAGGGGGDVDGNATSVTANEQIQLITLSSGVTVLRASNGEYICPDAGGTTDVHAYGEAPTSDCYLTQYTLSDGRVAFQTSAGNYLRIEADGDFTAATGQLGTWTRFEVSAQ